MRQGDSIGRSTAPGRGLEAPASPKIEVVGLIKNYAGKAVIQGVHFQVQSGIVFGLLGPNGAGKTTVLECLLGLRLPDGGSILIDGVDAKSAPGQNKAKIGAMLQSIDLQDGITPREAIELFGAFYAERTATREMLERFRLLGEADAPFSALSVGQRQRLALALASVHNPEILCLDEPTAGLDAQSRRDLHMLIRQWRDEGRTILLTTHYIEEAHALCDQVAVMHEGRVVASGPPGSLIARSRMYPVIVMRTREPLDPEGLYALPEVIGVEIVEEEARLEVTKTGAAVTALVRMIEAQNNELIGLQITQPSLEDTLIELTGGEHFDGP